MHADTDTVTILSQYYIIDNVQFANMHNVLYIRNTSYTDFSYTCMQTSMSMKSTFIVTTVLLLLSRGGVSQHSSFLQVSNTNYYNLIWVRSARLTPVWHY